VAPPLEEQLAPAANNTHNAPAMDTARSGASSLADISGRIARLTWLESPM
jgi:hypothetical protein